MTARNQAGSLVAGDRSEARFPSISYIALACNGVLEAVLVARFHGHARCRLPGGKSLSAVFPVPKDALDRRQTRQAIPYPIHLALGGSARGVRQSS